MISPVERTENIQDFLLMTDSIEMKLVSSVENKLIYTRNLIASATRVLILRNREACDPKSMLPLPDLVPEHYTSSPKFPTSEQRWAHIDKRNKEVHRLQEELGLIMYKIERGVPSNNFVWIFHKYDDFVKRICLIVSEFFYYRNRNSFTSEQRWEVIKKCHEQTERLQEKRAELISELKKIKWGKTMTQPITGEEIRNKIDLFERELADTAIWKLDVDESLNKLIIELIQLKERGQAALTIDPERVDPIVLEQSSMPYLTPSEQQFLIDYCIGLSPREKEKLDDCLHPKTDDRRRRVYSWNPTRPIPAESRPTKAQAIGCFLLAQRANQAAGRGLQLMSQKEIPALTGEQKKHFTNSLLVTLGQPMRYLTLSSVGFDTLAIFIAGMMGASFGGLDKHAESKLIEELFVQQMDPVARAQPAA